MPRAAEACSASAYSSPVKAMKEPLADAADEKHGLLGADTVLAGHARQGRVHLHEAMRSAAACRFVELDKPGEARLVVDMGAIEDGHALMYRRNPSFALAEVRQIALLPDQLQHVIGGGSGQEFARMKYPDAVLLR